MIAKNMNNYKIQLESELKTCTDVEKQSNANKFQSSNTKIKLT